MARRPVVGVLCANEVVGRPVQTVATRFVPPLRDICGASVVLLPAVGDGAEVPHLAPILDGLLLTGARSHVWPGRYGAADPTDEPADHDRDLIALTFAEAMIALGKPVYGICRGMQELNVLFGGSLASPTDCARHHRGSWEGDYAELFAHRHAIDLSPNGVLAAVTGLASAEVNSVHQQAIDRLGGGLSVEAIATDDGAIEAIRGTGCGADVLAVQWHPEWDVARCESSRAFFDLLGASLHAPPGCQANAAGRTRQ